MGLGKVKNIFDPTELGEADNVGAYLRSADGTLLTHTTVGGSEALDVNIVSPIPLDVDLDGDYDGTINTNPDSIGVIVHDRGATLDETDQNFRPSGALPTADALDPANIHALDVNSFMFAWNGASFDRVEKTVNGLKVDLQNSDITLEVSECYSDYATSYDSLSGVEALVGGIITADRCEITIFNVGNHDCWIGKTGVLVTTGFKLPVGASYTFKLGNVPLYGICAAGKTTSVSVMEGKI